MLTCGVYPARTAFEHLPSSTTRELLDFSLAFLRRISVDRSGPHQRLLSPLQSTDYDSHPIDS